MDKNYRLYHGDCLEVMDNIPDKSVDMVLADPPYGTTACKWDIIIPLDDMWKQLKRVIKKNGAIALFSSQPFTSVLVSSNWTMFRYEWIYNKSNASNFANCKKTPLKYHENVLIFYSSPPTYIPQMQKREGGGEARNKSNKPHNRKKEQICEITNILLKYRDTNKSKLKYPSTIQKFNNKNPKDRGLHPTQKPVALLEYLIKTYTKEKETILDFCMGSGSTGKAAQNLNRKFIGIEKDPKYFKIAQERLKPHPLLKEEIKNNKVIQYRQSTMFA